MPMISSPSSPTGPPSRPKGPLPRIDPTDILRLYHEGQHLRAISKATHHSLRTVRLILRAQGLSTAYRHPAIDPAPILALHDQGAPIVTIAKKTHHTHRTARAILQAHGRAPHLAPRLTRAPTMQRDNQKPPITQIAPTARPASLQRNASARLHALSEADAALIRRLHRQTPPLSRMAIARNVKKSPWTIRRFIEAEIRAGRLTPRRRSTRHSAADPHADTLRRLKAENPKITYGELAKRTQLTERQIALFFQRQEALLSPSVTSRPAPRSGHTLVADVAALLAKGLRPAQIASHLHRHNTSITRLIGRHPELHALAQSLPRYGIRRTSASPLSSSHTAPPIDETHLAALARGGTPHSQIIARYKISASTLDRIVREDRKRWDTTPKRTQEGDILTSTAKHLASLKEGGAAIVLTATEIASHIKALPATIHTLVIPEHDRTIQHAIYDTLGDVAIFPMKVRFYPGDFWDAATEHDGPIAFLDFDGMGRLPQDLSAKLLALAPKLTTPAVIRLTMSLRPHPGKAQVKEALVALKTLNRGRTPLIDIYPIREPNKWPRMATVTAFLGHPATHPHPDTAVPSVTPA